MFTSSTQIRVHYALTDQMGVVYHGRYAEFFEIGRSEAIRDLGFTYKDIEAMGVIMAVVEMNIKYIRPIRYDDLINVKTTLTQLPTDHRVSFHSEIYSQDDQLLSKGIVTFYFLEAKNMQKTNMPEPLFNLLKGYF
jgi:acyl-CoA thioester hydrolase